MEPLFDDRFTVASICHMTSCQRLLHTLAVTYFGVKPCRLIVIHLEHTEEHTACTVTSPHLAPFMLVLVFISGSYCLFFLWLIIDGFHGLCQKQPDKTFLRLLMLFPLQPHFLLFFWCSVLQRHLDSNIGERRLRIHFPCTRFLWQAANLCWHHNSLHVLLVT